MVYKDHWYLEKWIQYYGQHLGETNLYVISHGDDPVHCKLAKNCNHVRIPRNQLPEDFDEQRWRMLSDLCTVLNSTHDWVICGDVDEIIIPARADETVIQVLESQTPKTVIGAVGFEVMPHSESQWLLQFSPRYSKPSILGRRIKLSLGAHGAFCDWAHIPDLALIHFPLANQTSFQQRGEALAADIKHLRETPATERTSRQKALIRWGKEQHHKAELVTPQDAADSVVPLLTASRQAAPLLTKSMKTVDQTEIRVAPRKLRNVNIFAEIDDRLMDLFS